MHKKYDFDRPSTLFRLHVRADIAGLAVDSSKNAQFQKTVLKFSNNNQLAHHFSDTHYQHRGHFNRLLVRLLVPSLREYFLRRGHYGQLLEFKMLTKLDSIYTRHVQQWISYHHGLSGPDYYFDPVRQEYVEITCFSSNAAQTPVEFFGGPFVPSTHDELLAEHIYANGFPHEQAHFGNGTNWYSVEQNCKIVLRPASAVVNNSRLVI